MCIFHVITGLQKAAGTSVFACELASQQAADGHEVSILVKSRSPLEHSISPSVRIITKDDPSALQLQLETTTKTIVHLHALWDPWLTKMARHFRKQGAKIVWSPHGMLTPWALKNKWPKKVAGLLAYQYWALRKADLLHATADSEVEDIRRLYLNNEVVLAPLGVHLNGRARSPVSAEAKPSLRSKSLEQCAPQKYICFVSRIQRKKGLPNLIRAWAQLPADLKAGWQIKIAGPDEDNHLSELYALCDSLHVPYDNRGAERSVGRAAPSAPQDSSVLNPQFEIEFLGPVYDDAKDQLYANAAFSVLPTHSENFGSVVIESLAQGTPVICTKGAPWRDLVDHKCGWWIDIGVDPLVAALKEAIQLFNIQPSAFNLMGQNGLALVKQSYTWPAIAQNLISHYSKLTPNP